MTFTNWVGIIILLGSFFLAENINGQDLEPSSLINLIIDQQDSLESTQLIQSLASEGAIPYTFKDSCLFIYMGSAQSVAWNGDFNGWGGNRMWNNQGVQIREGIWVLIASFPKDARLDYKVVVDGEWILDPLNPYQQWTGMGGGSANSELRMPGWSPEPLTVARPDGPKGRIENHRISSPYLKHDAAFQIYYPFEFDRTKPYPILYFTDGQEYSDKRIGGVPTTLDNLIADQLIPPTVAVFYDPRDPEKLSQNHRMEELALEPDFLRFFIDALIPFVEDTLQIELENEKRAIIGTSLGGLNAAYFSTERPEIFQLSGIQSPAFQFRSGIYEIIKSSEGEVPVKTYMSTGVINDTETAARKMKTIMEQKNYVLKYREVNEGHSWGNWRALIDDMLIFLLEE